MKIKGWWKFMWMYDMSVKNIFLEIYGLYFACMCVCLLVGSFVCLFICVYVCVHVNRWIDWVDI